MALAVKKEIGFVDWCHRLSGWDAFVLTTIKLPEARAEKRFLQGASTAIYSLGKDSYDFGDPQQDQTLAFYYLVYRRKCKQAGFEPSEYADPVPDDDEVTSEA